LGLRRAETAGRLVRTFPYGKVRLRLDNMPSVLRTAARCDAGFPSALLRFLARPVDLLLIGKVEMVSGLGYYAFAISCSGIAGILRLEISKLKM